MNRRQFVTSLLGAAAAAVLLPKLEAIPFAPDSPAWFDAGEVLRKGDIFTIEGVHAVNPATYQPLEYLQRFVVTDDMTSESVSVDAISPLMITEGPYRNVDALPAMNAKITPLMTGPWIPCTYSESSDTETDE